MKKLFYLLIIFMLVLPACEKPDDVVPADQVNKADPTIPPPPINDSTAVPIGGGG